MGCDIMYFARQQPTVQRYLLTPPLVRLPAKLQKARPFTMFGPNSQTTRRHTLEDYTIAVRIPILDGRTFCLPLYHRTV